MLNWSPDPQVAERQMQAIIFSLTTFGHIDGDFDDKEKEFVRQHIAKLVAGRVESGMKDADAATKKDVTTRFTKHFLEVFENVTKYVADVMHEPVGKDESRDAFVHAKLKLRCFELFKTFDRPSQEGLLETVDEFIMADGHMHPAETKFRSELAQLLGSVEDAIVVDIDEASMGPVRISTVVDKVPSKEDHPFFKQFEVHYSSDQDRMMKQVAADLALVDKAIETIGKMAEKGKGQLAGKKTVADVAPGSFFLDGHTYCVRPNPGQKFDLTVVGDLHGCYSCLKGAVMQTDFLGRVTAYKNDPKGTPYPLLVLLGDYIDRGIFSLNGVLRSALQLFVTAPEHVVVLRGNHEYYVEYKGQIYGGVKPAEAINTLKPYLSIDVFRKYMALFEVMPNVLLFDRAMFVHAGIPRDRALKEKWKDLSSMNDADLRFQMMWSDPSTADVIPAQLQDQSARFPFGKLQFQSFMQRIGCHMLVRGHEKIEEGIQTTYDDPAGTLITLFSAGGKENDDLPEGSSYRGVTPMALTIHAHDGALDLEPFRLDWARYNDPDHNGFFKSRMEIEHRVE
ncbi:MAG: metallophosphoesterase family protein [Sandaracinus sp.]